MKRTKISGELCFKDVSLQVLKLPLTLQNLHIIIDSCFDVENCTFQYVDTSNQSKLIWNEDNYQDFLQDSLKQPIRPIRIKIIEGSAENINNINLSLPEVEEAKFPDPLCSSKSQVKKDWWALEDKAEENLKLVERLREQMDKIIQGNNQAMTPEMKTTVENTEEVLNLFEDFNKMPECAERSLLALKFLAARNRLSQQLQGLDLPPSFSYSEEFKTLEERFKLEGLLTNKVKDSIKKCQTYAQAGDWRLSDEILTHLLEERRTLDVPKILRLIAESDKARDMNANEDVFLLLGGSGSGKSTTIHFLGGSKMAVINEDGVPHIVPLEIKNPCLRKTHCSSKTRSETRFVVSVTVDPNHVKMESFEKKIILDSPGFEDTEGFEREISNTVSIKRVISLCKSVRIILVMSSKSQGDRNDGLKAGAEILVKMIPNIQEHVGGLVYFFTKYDDDKITRSSIRRSIKSAAESVKGTEIEHVLNDMHEKTKEDRGGPIIINPLKVSQAGKILDDLMEDNDRLRIRRPGEVLQCGMSEKAEGVLQDQANRYVGEIEAALRQKEFKLVKYKFDQLQSFQEKLNSHILEAALQRCKKLLKECDDQVLKEALTIAEDYFGENNVLNQDVIVKYQKLIEQSIILKYLKEEYLENALPALDLSNILDGKVEDLSRCIQQKEIDDPVIGQIFRKLLLLSESFSDLKSKCQETKNQMQRRFEAICVAFTTLLNQEDAYEKIGTELNKMKESIDILQDENLAGKYEESRQAFYENLRSYVNKTDTEFKSSTFYFNQKKIEAARVCILKLESMKDIETLRSYLQPPDNIEKLLEPLITTLKCYFEEITMKVEERTKDELNQQEKETFDVLKSSLDEMKIIKELPKMQNATLKGYHKIMEDVKSFLQKLKRNLIETISKIFNENDKAINAEKIKINIDLLLEMTGWPEEIKNVLEGFHSEIREVLLAGYDTLCETLQKILLSEDSVDDISKLDGLMMSVKNHMVYFEKIFPDLKQRQGKVEEIFDTKMEGLLKKIEKFVAECSHVDQKSFHFKRSEKILQCLKACQEMKFKNVRADEISDKLKEFIFSHGKFLKENCIQSSYNTIKEYMQNFSNGSKEYFGSSPNNSQNDMEISMNTTFVSRGSNGSVDLTPKGTITQIKKELAKHRDIIRDSFERIKEMQKTLCSVFGGCNYDTDIKNEMKRSFQRDADDFSEIMEGLRNACQFRDLRLLIIAMKVLRGLDDSFETAKLWENIATFHKEEVDKAEKERKIEGLEEIDRPNPNYSEISQIMSNLKESEDIVNENQFSGMKKKLNNKFSSLLNETENLLNSFRKDQIPLEAAKKIQKNLREVEEIKANVKDYLEASSEKLLIVSDSTIKEKLNENLLEFIFEVEKSLNNYCFEDAEKKKEDLQSIRIYLKSYLEEKIIDKIENLEKFCVDVLNNLLKKFENKTVDDLSKIPLQRILPKFESVSHDNKYSSVFDIIRQKIIQAFERELEEARNFQNNNRSNPHFLIIELTMRTLPSSIVDSIKPRVENCKNDILDLKQKQDSMNQLRIIQQEAQEARLAEMKQSSDPRKIAKFLEDCIIESRSNELDVMRIHLIQKTEKLRLGACNKLQSKQIHEVQKLIVTLSQDIECLFQYCPEVNEGNFVLQLLLVQTFDEVFDSYTKLFEKKKIGKMEKSLIEKAEVDFLLLVDFMNLMQCPSIKFVVDEDTLVKINSKIDNMVDETIRYFKFEEAVIDLTAAIEYVDIAGINAILSSIKDLYHLFTTILNSSVTTFQLNRIANNINEVRNYGEMIKVLDKSLKEKFKIIEGYFDKFFNQGMNKAEIEAMNDAVFSFLIITDFLDSAHKNQLESKGLGLQDLKKSFTEKIDKFYMAILGVFTKVKFEEGIRVLEGLPHDCVCRERFGDLIQEKIEELQSLKNQLDAAH